MATVRGGAEVAAQALGIFIAGVAVLDALKKLLHLQVWQVVAHALAQYQAHAVADLFRSGLQGGILGRFLGSGATGNQAGHGNS